MFNSQQIFQSKIDITVGGTSITGFPVTLNITSQNLRFTPVFWDNESDVALSGKKRSNLRGYDFSTTLDYDAMLEPDKLETILDGLVFAKNDNYVVRFYPDASKDDNFVVIPTGDIDNNWDYEETVRHYNPTLTLESKSILTQISSEGTDPIQDDIDADTLDGLDSTQFLRSDVSDTFEGDVLTLSSDSALAHESSGTIIKSNGLIDPQYIEGGVQASVEKSDVTQYTYTHAELGLTMDLSNYDNSVSSFITQNDVDAVPATTGGTFQDDITVDGIVTADDFVIAGSGITGDGISMATGTTLTHASNAGVDIIQADGTINPDAIDGGVVANWDDLDGKPSTPSEWETETGSDTLYSALGHTHTHSEIVDFQSGVESFSDEYGNWIVTTETAGTFPITSQETLTFQGSGDTTVSHDDVNKIITISSASTSPSNATITLTAGTWLSDGGTFNLNQSSAEEITFNVNTASVLSAVTGNATWDSGNFNNLNWDSAYTHSNVTSGNPHNVDANDVGAVPSTGGTFSGTVRYSTQNVILQTADAGRTLIGGGFSYASGSGAYIIIEGEDYGGVGAGNKITLNATRGVFVQSNEVWHAGNFTDNSTNWDTAYDRSPSAFNHDHNTAGRLTIARTSSTTLSTDLTSLRIGDGRSTSDFPTSTGASNFMPPPDWGGFDAGIVPIFTQDWAGSSWGSVVNFKGWNSSYASWQIAGNATNSTDDRWYLRTGVNSTWNSWKQIAVHGDNVSFGTGSFSGALTSNALATLNYGATIYDKRYGGNSTSLELTTDDWSVSSGVGFNAYRSGNVNGDISTDGQWSLRHSQSGNSHAGLFWYSANGNDFFWGVEKSNPSIGGAVSFKNIMVLDGDNERLGIRNLTPSYTLDVSGDVHSTQTMYAQEFELDSDRAFKTDEQELTGYEFRELIPKSFYKHGEFGYGYIAQEVREKYPELVTKHDNGYLTLRQNDIIGMNTAGLQRIDSEVQTLKNKVRHLEQELKQVQ